MSRLAAPNASAVSGDGRDALLEQIRAGRNLRPVASRAQRPEVPNNEKLKKETNVLTDALARAMELRCKATQCKESYDRGAALGVRWGMNQSTPGLGKDGVMSEIMANV